MDVGGGDFTFGNDAFKHLSQLAKTNKELKFEIFSLRGEYYPGKEKEESDNCTHYRLGAFKIENLVEEFSARGFDLINSVDLIVSSWTLRHLVDPVGTLSQIHYCLRNEQGIFLGDGFAFTLNNLQSGFDNLHPFDDTSHTLYKLDLFRN